MFKDHVEEIGADINKARLIVAHNVAFDIRFIEAEMQRAGMKFPTVPCYCTMNRGKEITGIQTKRGLKNPKMNELCEALGVDKGSVSKVTNLLFGTEVTEWHDARMDAVAAYLCYKKMTTI